ncbi:MAG TPA: CAP domain-containing protein, partial [Thermomicrobiales bacterium]|nr:CAP domain-containing protein [Thermomicrobiales bacterium]
KKKNRNNKKTKNSNGGGGGYAADGEERAFLNLINDYRSRNGLAGLALQDQLGAAADHHSQDMAQKNYFAHCELESVKNFGYTNWLFIGENIYAGSESASSAMDAWKNSAGHNKNMLDGKFTEIGIGRAYNQNSKYGWYWTTTFGSR